MLTIVPIPLLTRSPPPSFQSLTSFRAKNEPILAFCSRVDGLILEMAHCKLVIPPLLLVMLFLHELHSCYSDIVEQFWTRHKSFETTSIEIIVADVTYHDKFILKEPRPQDKSSKPPSQIPAASVAHTDNAGTVRSSQFDWLCKGYGKKGIRTCWKKELGGTDICPIYHRETPKHVPTDCLLLKSLNLKLIHVAPVASPPAPTPAASQGHSFPWGSRGYCRPSSIGRLDWKCYHPIWSHGLHIGCFGGF
jgi:hypothetical protein